MPLYLILQLATGLSIPLVAAFTARDRRRAASLDGAAEIRSDLRSQLIWKSQVSRSFQY